MIRQNLSGKPDRDQAHKTLYGVKRSFAIRPWLRLGFFPLEKFAK